MKNAPTLSVIELRLSEGISQQKIPLYRKLLKFRSDLVKVSRVGLKVCLGLVLPNQCYHIVVRRN